MSTFDTELVQLVRALQASAGGKLAGIELRTESVTGTLEVWMTPETRRWLISQCAAISARPEHMSKRARRRARGKGKEGRRG